MVWLDGLMDGEMDGWYEKYGWMMDDVGGDMIWLVVWWYGGWMDGGGIVDGWLDGEMDGWMVR